MSLRMGGILATTGLVILLAGAAPAVASETDTTTVKTSTEAWYTTTGACGDPADCSAVQEAPESPAYPEDTLHVDVNAGQQTAATYLQLDTSALPFGSEITGGTLTLPIDDDAQDGSLAPDSAKLVACAVTEPIQEANGSTSKPPKTDCKRASAAAKFAKGKKPAFTVDIAAFATHWTRTGAADIAIIPAPAAESDRDTWHVTFWGKDNKAPAAEPITAMLSHKASEDNLLSPPADLAVPGPISAPKPDVAPEIPDSGPIEAPAPPEALADKPKPEAAEAAPEAEVAPQAMPMMREVGYPYPAAWLMPLALLVGFGLVGRALTKNLDAVERDQLSPHAP